MPVTGFAGLDAPLSLADLDSDHPYTLGIPQTRTEELLEQRACEMGVPIRRGHEVIGLEQDADGVAIGVYGPDGKCTLRAAYLAGCDGGRSTVRKLAGIAFPGTEATRYWLLGDVGLTDPASLPVGSHRTPGGSVAVIPRPGYVRVITAERERPANRDAPVTLEEFRAAVRLALGRDVEMTAPRWLTRFGDAARQAERYVSGRVVLAGDAAHIHPPAGAQGLNVGLQDAFNLGWKLAAQVRGWAPAGLLESYHSERHAAGARVLLNTRAQVALADRARSSTRSARCSPSWPPSSRSVATWPRRSPASGPATTWGRAIRTRWWAASPPTCRWRPRWLLAGSPPSCTPAAGSCSTWPTDPTSGPRRPDGRIGW